MYISVEQLAASLKKLNTVHPFFCISFLAFKVLNLPIDVPKRVDIAGQETLILETYYNPFPKSQYYYVPLRADIGRKNRWIKKDSYPQSRLQKNRTTTFSSAFLHPTRSNEWAWSTDYLSQLSSRLKGERIPAFHLATWMFRDQNWLHNTTPEDIIRKFFSQFAISQEEQKVLFDSTSENVLISTPLLQEETIASKRLHELIGNPPDSPPDEGGGLEKLTLVRVGPAQHISLQFAPRLNIITGDNGLGKTFLLDCAWWALSGRWADPDQPAYPLSNDFKSSIEFVISGSFAQTKQGFFDTATQSWSMLDEKRPVLPGIVIYARVDGSCVIWDPAKHYWTAEDNRARGATTTDIIRLSQNEIWDGKNEPRSGRAIPICNGLIRDWVTWQHRPAIGAFNAFTHALEKLSPHSDEFTLKPGNITNLPNDARDIPTIQMPYGEVPIVHLSAGIKRVLSLAYLLVWTWEGHKIASNRIGKTPQSKLVFLVDEMEAHLHPKWQRMIVPALMEVIKILENQLEIQLLIATHSPLVTASIESIFQDKLDSLFTLDFVNQEVVAKEVQYIKHGSINSWLTSEIFDLRRPYSIDAEKALIDAKQLQMMEYPDPEKIKEVSNRLMQHLPDIDPIWPRWKFFAERNGVNL